MRNSILVILISTVLFACNNADPRGLDEVQFASHWYQNKAEINVFDLKQMRYGEERSGEAVMIFVTEDFSKRKQVKLDQPENAGNDAQKVLKMHMSRDFLTGIYPYHTMLSVFTPIYDQVNAPKITASVSEWCGQAFVQMNWKNNTYKVKLFSYFEDEGDQEININGMAEDEIFNLIRLNPDLVSTGHARLIPSLIYQRFTHSPMQSEPATISKKTLPADQGEIEIKYLEIERKVVVRFMDVFPYQILGWQEFQTNQKGEEEVTSAKRRAMKLVDYWNKTSSSDEYLRKDLGF
jgi:hypothetical protein